MHTGGRTKNDIDASGVLVDFAGVLVRDGYAVYTHLVDAQHVWCGAHSLRDLKAVYDADPTGQPGAQAMATTPDHGAARHPRRPRRRCAGHRRRPAVVSALGLRR